ncbi:chemotaxis protein CheR [Pseudonocardia sulfidoxydans NBRC 16205]|uniref:protein-glutamate O-methyltransferase n=1 Tax=Pseudonocardia sulfidoxydans NBRC 16205 TaxID=1223511 RepID=A0A511DS14_9PSEU|nr:CheR family methyltransferase [Pseudonocardia sulfidoxydans]GEL25838.1 chemotaxis protein CheR [Pseudonocardia sulfidoxydans NBRC 16205]
MSQPDPDFEALLHHLKQTRGFDFTGYKRSSLVRRVARRMSQVGVTEYGDYLDYLELHAEEFTALFNTILINVTGFFRDPEAWEYLRTEVLPALLAGKGATEPVRVWSAGCASGEEAYTLAILLAEMLGPAEFRDRVKIYATDVDEEALAYARQGTYSEREVAGVPDELREQYFEQLGGRFTFRKDLRRSVIFGRNDLVQDAPISRIDLLVCRNTLMYFNAETQARILARFHFGLSDPGVLFLGKAEMLLSHGATVMPVDLKRRTFRKAPRTAPQNGTLFADPLPVVVRTAPDGLDLLRDEAVLASPLAQVVLNADGLIAVVNRQAEVLFGISTRDVGRPFRDLELSYRPLELRRHIEKALEERRTVRITDVTYNRGPEVVHLEVQVSPLANGDVEPLGVSVAFHDVTDFRRLQDELEQANRQLETAYEELQSTNEELETTNEELQSTNEELETMNEELQSTNDELQTINDELQDRTGELDRSNDFLETILTSLRAGVVVVGPELVVQVWNHQAEELWGLRRDEAVGEHLLNLDIGLPLDQVRPVVRGTLAGDDGPQEVLLAAINRRGRSIDVRVVASPLRGEAGAVVGAILTMEEAAGVEDVVVR